jgi:hypothetical protein
MGLRRRPHVGRGRIARTNVSTRGDIPARRSGSCSCLRVGAHGIRPAAGRGCGAGVSGWSPDRSHRRQASAQMTPIPMPPCVSGSLPGSCLRGSGRHYVRHSRHQARSTRRIWFSNTFAAHGCGHTISAPAPRACGCGVRRSGPSAQSPLYIRDPDLWARARRVSGRGGLSDWVQHCLRRCLPADDRTAPPSALERARRLQQDVGELVQAIEREERTPETSRARSTPRRRGAP